MALFLVPSRQLAYQIHAWCRRVLPEDAVPDVDRVVRCIVRDDGMDKEKEMERLVQEPPHMVVGTPEHVLECARRNALDVSHTRLIVMDEIDRLLRLPGKYAPVEKRIIREKHPTPVSLFLEEFVVGRRFVKRPQLVAASASLNAVMKNELIRRRKWFAQDAVEVDARVFGDGGSEQNADVIPRQIQHYCILASTDHVRNMPMESDIDDQDQQNEKVETHQEEQSFMTRVDAVGTILLLDAEPKLPAMVFIHPQRSVSTVVHRLKTLGAPAVDLASIVHGDPLPRAYVTTSAMSHGIDLPGLKRVYILDIPVNGTDYLHMAGRTGRMGAEGDVISIVPDEPKSIAKMKAVYASGRVKHQLFEHVE